MNALDTAIAAPWAMLSEHVEELVAIAARENDVTPEALEAYRARYAERGERLKIRENVAILDVYGPLFKRANLFVQFSGATSYEILRRDLQVALDDQSVDAIMLKVDSPGGEVSGCDELAAAVYEARGKKPITAYVTGMACSGAYWIASAADRIVVSSSSTIGSIGVVLGITDRRKAEERAGISRIEFVSSQSPGKRPDLETDEGKRRVQKMVDDLGAVFVTAVAMHRNVDVDTVISKFGNGGVEIGANAVAVGMVDEVGQFEAALAALSTRGKNRRLHPFRPRSFNMDTPDVAKITAEAQTAERTRISAINKAPGAKEHPDLAAAFIEQGTEAAAATSFLALALKGTDAAVAAAKPETKEPSQGEKEQTFLKDKAEAGALGLGAPETPNEPTKAAGWGKAVAQATRHIK